MHRERSQAFTLIELLVVISIIAVLAAMLLPAIGMVRDSAKLAKCGSNERQIGMATIVYANESSGALPFNYNSVNSQRGHEKQWMEVLIAQYVDVDRIVTNAPLGNMIFACPASPITGVVKSGQNYVYSYSGTTSATNSYEGSMYYLYACLGDQTNYDRISRAANLTTFSHTSQTPWQFCSNRNAIINGFGGIQGSSWHKGYRRPTVFLDAHVQTLVSNLYCVGGGNNLYPTSGSLVPGSMYSPPAGQREGDFWIAGE